LPGAPVNANYYADKVMFGSDKIKVFLKGALGMQIAGLKREGLVDIDDSDFGFFGGGGAGVMVFLKENIFINVEYEIARTSNSWYNDGRMNSAMAGIGFKF
jgi:opacity protein-like surface antigen